MLNNLKILQKRYGLWDGLKVYWALKFRKEDQLNLPQVPNPIHYRPKTIDEYTIIEIFGEDCYNIKLPFKPQLIIDAGANIGLSSVFFAKEYPYAKIIAIEPEAENYKLLLKNASYYNNIEPLQSAIWKSTALLEIRDKGYGLRGFVVEEVSKESPFSFKALSIAEIAQAYDKIDVLKIDIEGSEKVLFEENYENWLPKVRCLIIELHDDMIEDCSKTVFKTIENYDFSFYKKEENWVFMNNEM